MDKIFAGSRGEKKAANYLLQNGYKILQLNFRAKRYGEIDIVAQEGKTLVFVEVKTRFSHKFGYPEEAVTPRKLASIIRTGEYYKLIYPKTPDLMRIDVVAVDEVDQSIRLIRNVSQ